MINPHEKFLDKLIDWKDFEKFVSELYKGTDEVKVKHNVTEFGKSGAKRQVDVMVLQKTKLHTIKTLIECKRWKDKVDRPIIDIMAAAVRDLSANKGVIFTTTGFEEGAEKYARSENIDIFLVRDIHENEWGRPGKVVWFYNQYFNSLISDFSFQGVKLVPRPGQLPPTNKSIKLEIKIGPNQEYPEYLQLYSLTEEKGPHFTKILIDVRNDFLKRWMDSAHVVLDPADGNPQTAVDFTVTLNFGKYPFRYLKHEGCLLSFEKMSFRLMQSVTQTKTIFDRTDDKDFALIVENYITNQRNFVSKQKNSENIELSNPIEDKSKSEGEIMENGSILKVMFEPHVLMQLKSDTVIHKLNDTSLDVTAPMR